MTWRYETREVTGARDWLAHNPEVADPYLVLATSGNASGGLRPCACHAAREHGSTRQLSALPHGAAARTTVCMFGSLMPSDRSSELRSFGLSGADYSGILSGSRPMQHRMRRSRSNVLHSAHGSAYAAGQQHSRPPHTRKGTGSIPVGTTHCKSALTFSAFLMRRFAPVKGSWSARSGREVFPGGPVGERCEGKRHEPVARRVSGGPVALRVAERRPQSKNQTGRPNNPRRRRFRRIVLTPRLGLAAWPRAVGPVPACTGPTAPAGYSSSGCWPCLTRR